MTNWVSSMTGVCISTVILAPMGVPSPPGGLSVGIPGQPLELPTCCGRKSCVFGFTVNRQILLVLQSGLFINVSLVFLVLCLSDLLVWIAVEVAPKES